MSLIKTIKEKLAENASLKDIKHIIKRQKEGKALANFNRYAEEMILQKMHIEGKSPADLLVFAADKANHFELKWNEKRMAKALVVKAPKAEKAPKAAKAETPVPATAPAAPATEAEAPATEAPKKRRKKA